MTKPDNVIPFRSISELKKAAEEMKTGSCVYMPSDKFAKLATAAEVKEKVQLNDDTEKKEDIEEAVKEEKSSLLNTTSE